MTGQAESSIPIQGQQFPAAARLNRQADFDAVFAGNRFAADETLVVTATRTRHANSRLGLSIGRQVGNAVVRNLWKRLIREAYRRNRQRIPSALDIVVRPRKGAIPSLDRVERSLLALTQRIERDLQRGPRFARPPLDRSSRPRRGEQR